MAACSRPAEGWPTVCPKNQRNNSDPERRRGERKTETGKTERERERGRSELRFEAPLLISERCGRGAAASERGAGFETARQLLRPEMKERKRRPKPPAAASAFFLFFSACFAVLVLTVGFSNLRLHAGHHASRLTSILPFSPSLLPLTNCSCNKSPPFEQFYCYSWGSRVRGGDYFLS